MNKTRTCAPDKKPNVPHNRATEVLARVNELDLTVRETEALERLSALNPNLYKNVIKAIFLTNPTTYLKTAESFTETARKQGVGKDVMYETHMLSVAIDHGYVWPNMILALSDVAAPTAGDAMMPVRPVQEHVRQEPRASSFGELVRKLRNGLGMSQTDLGKRIRTTQTRISEMERDVFYPIHGSELLEDLAKALGTTPAELNALRVARLAKPPEARITETLSSNTPKTGAAAPPSPAAAARKAQNPYEVLAQLYRSEKRTGPPRPRFPLAIGVVPSELAEAKLHPLPDEAARPAKKTGALAEAIEKATTDQAANTEFNNIILANTPEGFTGGTYGFPDKAALRAKVDSLYCLYPETTREMLGYMAKIHNDNLGKALDRLENAVGTLLRSNRGLNPYAATMAVLWYPRDPMPVLRNIAGKR
ncbi:MAG TPA: helix-turn-helix transcriptional regulator [Candidatus Saccharimonadales bacterium]|nr:helix-turn-helix transcriptional regulator [Candidatus Saccharimonadales bacterium]